jgi:pimeloyl-ACP methyl ester carboxylesterase
VVRLLPRGRLVVLEGGTHTLNYTEPERMAAVIAAFIGGGTTA